MRDRGFVDRDLERAVFDTVRYFDLFRMPVTAVQIWRGLVVMDNEGVIERNVRLHEVREVLRDSAYLAKRVTRCYGYYCLAFSSGWRQVHVERYVRERLARHVLAQHKWKIARSVARWLVPIPFVKMIAGSGSLSLYNTRASSDLDLYFVVSAGRIWTARFFVLIVTQLTGRRRRYWDVEAPDKICLNHYVTDQFMMMPMGNRSIYTAELYSHMAVVYGEELYRQWMEANEAWVGEYVQRPKIPVLLTRQRVRVGFLLRFLKRVLEGFWLEPLGDYGEKVAEWLQRRAVAAHREPGQAGRVVLSDRELAFHPDTQAGEVVRRFDL